MTAEKNVFSALISQRKVTAELYEYIDNNKIPLDSSDLLRWQWVLAVSALDKYIHDIVRFGMVEEYSKRKPHTPKFDTFQLSMDVLSSIEMASIPEMEFANEVLRRHSHLSFQDPSKITEALSYIWNEPHKWDKISSNMQNSISSNDLTTKLKNIVARRNQIVHEGDCLMTILPLQQQPISLLDTNDVIEFICDLVNAIEKSIC